MASDHIFKRAENKTFRGFEKENNLNWKGPFTFIQAADSQFGLIDEFRYVDWSGDVNVAIQQSKEYKARGLNDWSEEIRLSSLAIQQWNRLTPKPRFAVICGDLVNDFPGMKFNFLQIKDFKEVYSKLDSDIPLVLLPGNHDIHDSPTEDSIAHYRQNFGDDYFSFWVDGVMFIVINSQYFKDRTSQPKLVKEQDEWLDERLEEVAKSNYKHVVVFQHIPWFHENVNEPEDMFNIAIEDRLRILNKFNEYGIRAVFAGHYHRNGGGHFKELEVIVTSALGAQIVGKIPAKSGYRIVEVGDQTISHQYINIDDVKDDV